MTVRMLIDARHREETRVAVVKANRIEEFDFESAERKQLKGNIYLAKVTRVEPSLQAAFVEYGGNRHGFLAFSEIHPDYYQIPKEDRDALLREEAEHAAAEAALRNAEDDHDLDEDGSLDPHHDDDGQDHDRPDADLEDEHNDESDSPAAEDANDEHGNDDSAAEDLRRKRMSLRRRYKIQDVIHRRQVLLIQVVKEERGNKGAALTTYLSLAGRYCVLMPNTTHGGGISRKISNAGDRKRLKSILSELNLPSTMGCIVRTAGLQRTKVEIKRDFDYLARLWDEIREKTLSSTAPALIHGDSDLIRRAVRDIYNKDVDEVIVEGEAGYKHAREIMKTLMPSHVKKVRPYADAVPLYQRYGVEDQLAAMYHPVVQLKSGGYLVINPTEALVSIDINSGRSTREHGIEATAVGTNLEAAHEIARQLRLRDMAGLVVIDFIDMDHHSNVRKVERAMKSALANDRARIQVGRISSFGLMEMSRQRLRTGVLEASTRACPHCEGTGLVRTASSAALSALRMLEEESARGHGSIITLRASQEAAFYLLNRKRSELAEIEERYGVSIVILSDGEVEGARMTVEASGPPPAFRPSFEVIVDEDEEDDIAPDAFDEEEDEESDDRGARRKRGRRRRGKRGRDRQEAHGEEGESSDDDADVDAAERNEGEAEGQDESGEARRKRRGRRGGRRRRGQRGDGFEARNGAETGNDGPASEEPVVGEAASEAVIVEAAETEADAKPKRGRRKKADVAAEETAPVPDTVPAEAPSAEEVPAEKPKRSRKKKEEAPSEAEADATPEPVEKASKPSRKKPVVDAAGKEIPSVIAADPAPEAPRKGWWQRTFGNEGEA